MLVNCVIHGTCIRTRLSRLRSLEVNSVIFGEQRFSTLRGIPTAALMIPQHQGAIDKARAKFKYGHNDELRRLAQNIITQQNDEVSAMRSAVGGGASTQAGSTSVSVRPYSVNSK
jgi:DUF305 family protein family protein